MSFLLNNNKKNDLNKNDISNIMDLSKPEL